MNNDNPVIALEKGNYLAPKFETHDFGNILISKTRNDIGNRTALWHKHENPMVSMVLYGGNLEFRENRQIERSNGSINFYHAHEYHKNDYRVFPSVHLGVEIEKSFLSEYAYQESSVKQAFQKGQEATFLLLKLLNEASVGDNTSATSSEMMLLSFLENTRADDTLASSARWMSVVRDILNDKWNTHLSLVDLGNLAGVHPVTISKNFKKYFNCTFGEYIRRLRVKKAIDLILLKKHSLSEIAYECGFSDQSHFIRVFKRYTGTLPKAIEKI